MSAMLDHQATESPDSPQPPQPPDTMARLHHAPEPTEGRPPRPPREVLVRARFGFERRLRRQIRALLQASPTLAQRSHMVGREVVIAGPPATLDDSAWAACYGVLRELARIASAGGAELSCGDAFFTRIHALGE
jgi:hypothetical protein